MNRRKRSEFLPGSVAILAGAVIVCGCINKPAHPDEKSAVTNALSTNRLSNVSALQDQDKGVLRLTGDVASVDQKFQAEALAGRAAPGYIVANEIAVRPSSADGQAKAVDSSIDSGIEGDFKASLILDKHLDYQSIDFSVANKTLVLKGSVETAAQKAEAGNLAKAVPSVQQVVNQIDVRPSLAARVSGRKELAAFEEIPPSRR